MAAWSCGYLLSFPRCLLFSRGTRTSYASPRTHLCHRSVLLGRKGGARDGARGGLAHEAAASSSGKAGERRDSNLRAKLTPFNGGGASRAPTSRPSTVLVPQ